MAILPNRLVVGPTQERGEAEISCVSITNTVPPDSYVSLDDNGIKILVAQDPEYEGQLKVYADGSLVQMYVVVNINSTLTWKQVKISTGLLNTSNAQPFSSL